MSIRRGGAIRMLMRWLPSASYK